MMKMLTFEALFSQNFCKSLLIFIFQNQNKRLRTEFFAATGLEVEQAVWKYVFAPF